MVLFAVVLVLGVGGGIWLAQSLPLLPAGGMLVGAAAGLVVAYVLLHDFHAAPRAARVTRRR